MHTQLTASTVKVFYNSDVERLGYQAVSAFDIKLADLKKKREVKTILVKPNLAIGIEYESGVVTHPYFVKGTVTRLREHFPDAYIIIGECKPMSVFRRIGFTSLSSFVELLDMRTKPVSYKFEGKEIREFSFPSVLNEVDLILNVGKLKVHRLAITSVCVKNLMGFLCKRSERSRMHDMIYPIFKSIDRAFNEEEFKACEAQLARRLVDLYSGFMSFLGERDIPIFHCADGYFVSEGDGFHICTPRPYHGGLAALNPWNLDHVASEILGHDPADIAYLKEGQKAGFYDPSKIKVEGIIKKIPTRVVTFKNRYFKEIRDALLKKEQNEKKHS